MILKLLLVIGVIFFVYTLFFKKKTRNTPNNAKTKTNPTQDVNELTECPTCGVYVELEEAILSGSKYYCSTECINKA